MVYWGGYGAFLLAVCLISTGNEVKGGPRNILRRDVLHQIPYILSVLLPLSMRTSKIYT